MQRKRRISAGFGFSNQRFLETLASLTGISPVGDYGRDTPLDLSSLENARGSLLLREAFSKYDDGKPSPEKEAKTWKRFHEAEDLCRDSNLQISRTFKYSPFWRAVAMRVKEALGEFSWDECYKHFAFGPGATTRLTRANAAAAYKYSGKPESTSGNTVLASCVIRMNPLWTQSALLSGEDPGDLVKVVCGNSIIAVPKNFKTNRTIAKEPCMNIYIQKGIGSVIRRRLKRVGIDLNTQVRNQEAAREGSLSGALATIDLSMASDTLAFELVSFLLPNDWWWALEQSRSPVGVLPSGEVLTYQKFSSMGNGYTFELETLIFWCICQEVCCANNINETDCRVLVYGDDIVVPSDKAEAVLNRLFQAGFKPNTDKTFISGPYRESCGKHYFLGHDITPFYVRKPVQMLHRLFLVHNNLFRFSERTGVDVTSALTRLKALAPAKWRNPRLPDGYGDGAFIGAVDELRLDSHPHGWECWVIRALQVSQDLLCDDLPFGQFIASLRAMDVEVNSPFERRFGISEHLSGLPVRAGSYRENDLVIERHTPLYQVSQEIW
jgi:hypothetical protein